ncbi:hypothetical protein OUO20_12505 [Arthrobacter sp. FX8]|uniref:glycosyltransferase family 2 protein n=1 Tax=Arthrobacter sp. FX8 TaxID=2997335 RepID=UPI00227B7CD9|nr:hypothetical protein [Arthrobacter sp. FX8]WAJ32010.1 hypothetical protein OUO20_12505 [Arthrobacter sp. FX8]
MEKSKDTLNNKAHGPDVLAVIPSIGGAGYDAVIELQDKLNSIEPISCLVISNSRSLTAHLRSLDVSVATDGSNRGFGHSVSIGAATSETWDWLLIVNDDINLEVDLFRAAIMGTLETQGVVNEIVYFDIDRIRRIPQRLQVFLQVSLLGKVLPVHEKHLHADSNSYRSFSCVAISRRTFELNAGFDPDLVFTYEDADFVSRAIRTGARQRCVTASGVTHSHSVSSGKYIDAVLPVATYSAAKYLDKLGSPRLLNTLIILAALALRILFVPATRSPKSKHLKGILSSCIAVINRGRVQPQLPLYSEL